MNDQQQSRADALTDERRIMDEAANGPHLRPVAWAVYNGWSRICFYMTEEDARDHAQKAQKNHDLSGSLAAFRVVPLYAAPQPAQADAPAEAREPAKVDTKARMDWAAGILRKLPPLDPTYSIISILDDHDREDRDEVLHSIRVFADMRATQALFTLYAAPQPAQADAPAEAREPHSDDVAVDSFAAAMKHKLALARAKGRGGWEACSPADLSRMLREHVEKGDPRDVANFCMMLWHHGSPIVSAPADSGEARLTDEPSLTNPLTPYGMLVRALRIVSGTTLMDMAKALLTTPAKLSAMEFGRAPVTPEFAFDVAAYFDALGVPCTESALRAAARAQGGES
ncbi:helix-turn-helix domain-containing protein [Burkholderia multivorans]|uniref:helix-turn-helix domain-containing protein n=1 Tax=Burkholderia multivorans TaxID=87883 RepID=UPI00018E3D37|nr:helix-turn-helix transcriptional regulator [Burkholderia multivorans]EED98627.1 conserved hypothetical protein [Burkholderia multivorans CGD1]